MPRKYNFDKPLSSDPDAPFETLNSTHKGGRDGLCWRSKSFYSLRTGGREPVGHFRIDLPEPAAYPGLNEYLDSAYAWISKNCRGYFEWSEGKCTETSLSADAADYKETSRFSISILFSHESDAKDFEDAYGGHNLFKRGRSAFDGGVLPFNTEEGITGTFLRYALKCLPSTERAKIKKSAQASPVPDIPRLTLTN